MGNHLLPVCAGVLLLLGIVALGSAECDTTKYFNLRSEWSSPDDPCQQSLAFDLWLVMKAEGSEENADAQHVLQECVSNQPVDTLQLSVTEDWEYTPSSSDCGEVTGRYARSAAYTCKSASDLEDICVDAGVSRAIRTNGGTRGAWLRGGNRSKRRLQTTVSEAGATHGVDELIAGLEALGCANTMGDGETLCVISDSFNVNGYQAALQASGDLPQTLSVVEDGSEGTDEGSAMMELAYDIAPNASYKFHTSTITEDGFAEAIISLASTEECTVIVDDYYFFAEASFRDGPVAAAVDSAVNDYNTLYFNSAGNDGYGLRFESNLECTEELFTDTTGPCTSGVPTHVFDDTATSPEERYFLAVAIESDVATIMFKFDEDEDLARDMMAVAWDTSTGSAVPTFSSTDAIGQATVYVQPIGFAGTTLYFTVHQSDTEPADLASMSMQIVANGATIEGAGDSSMFGGACASKAISVAAMSYTQATGADGTFSDPETASVEDFSSRGTCLVSTTGTLEERQKPATTATDELTTSTPGFSPFFGTSAAAPVAAAIATLIRAACAPEKVIGYDDIMEMITDYTYTVDYTGDADGAAETFGVEAGHGIFSASQLLAWVEANCASACPGDGTATGTPAPAAIVTPSPVVTPDTPAPIVPSPPTTVTPSPVTLIPDVGTPSPTMHIAHADSTPAPAVDTERPVSPTPPEEITTPAPVEVETEGTPSPVGIDEVGDVTAVTVWASGYDESQGAAYGDNGCGEDGCLPELTRDGDDTSDESRWSCKEDIVEPGMDQCELQYEFADAQDIASIAVVFYKWAERSRSLKISINGDLVGTFDSDPDNSVSVFMVEKEDVHSVWLESVGLHKDEWISLTEVAFIL